MFELNEHTKEILGRPNFTCAKIADILRASGNDIKYRAEDEQAHTIYFLLEMYDKHGENWLEKANERIKEIVEKCQN